MAGVTDAPFRATLSRYGKPDVIWTEMISLAGIRVRGEEEFDNEMRFSRKEHPIVVQFFGSDPRDFLRCGEIAKRRGFDGIDINMGCPDQGIEKQGAGARIMKSSELAKEIIKAATEGSAGLPVSVKTRTGYFEKEETERWMISIAEEKLAAVTIHGRTRAEKRKGIADWDSLRLAGEVIRSVNPDTVVLGNGDISAKEEGEERSIILKLNGYMVGRALLGNPWFFTGKRPSKKERLDAAIYHTDLFGKMPDGAKNFDLMKKHLFGYISGFVGAKEARVKLTSAKSADEAVEIIRNAIAF